MESEDYGDEQIAQKTVAKRLKNYKKKIQKLWKKNKQLSAQHNFWFTSAQLECVGVEMQQKLDCNCM